jgi:hypothetical protein
MIAGRKSGSRGLSARIAGGGGCRESRGGFVVDCGPAAGAPSSFLFFRRKLFAIQLWENNLKSSFWAFRFGIGILLSGDGGLLAAQRLSIVRSFKIGRGNR